MQREQGVLFQPIGFMKTCFPERRGTPRQGMLAPSTRGVLHLARSVPPAALEGLEQFTHIWVLYHFHENTNMVSEKGVSAKVAPPQLKGEKTGLFATRTPHRQQNLGLTVVRLLQVDLDKRTLTVRGIDLVNNTPVFDIKPYIPQYDALPEAVVPAWIAEGGVAPLDVVFADQVLETQLPSLLPTMEMYTELGDVLQSLEEVLKLDIRSVHQGRGDGGGEQGTPYMLRFDTLDVRFVVRQQEVVVTAVQLHRDSPLTSAAASPVKPASRHGGAEQQQDGPGTAPSKKTD
eukprot:m.201115 g.201115  ORF g.201115 m.201115 type:complete len:289 (-) comp21930_c0_seq2:48-914(-)